MFQAWQLRVEGLKKITPQILAIERPPHDVRSTTRDLLKITLPDRVPQVLLFARMLC